MSKAAAPAARPRGRPRKDAEVAPTDQMMAAATVNDELGASRNLLYQRFGSKAKLWRAAVDWAFGPLVEHLAAGDDESADPMVRLRVLIRNFIEYSATRPYLARLVMVESSSVTDRLEYLYHQYIEPIRGRFIPVFDQLREQGRIKNMPYDVFYFLLTSGGSAPFGQVGLASLMAPEMASPDPARVRMYAENVTEILLGGLSLPG
jgi:TetR/AcrR family transcriptional regulator